MPLPIGHSVISLGLYAAYRKDPVTAASLKSDWKTAALFVVAGLAPDIDFVTVPFLGFGSHRGFTHSFAFALISASFIYTFAKTLEKGLTRRLFFFLLLSASLHPVCDFFTYDYLVERGGVMLLYPLSSSYLQSPFPIFMGIELRYLRTILSVHTLVALIYETVLSSIFFLLSIYLKGKLNRVSAGAARGSPFGRNIED